MENSLRQFWSAARAAANDGRLVKLTLSKPRSSDPAVARNRYARVVDIKGGDHLQITHRYADREEAKNHLIGTGISLLESALGEDYGNADLYTPTEHLSVMTSKKGKVKFSRRSLAGSNNLPLHPRDVAQKIDPDFEVPQHSGTNLNGLGNNGIINLHDRKKKRLVAATRPYLHELGITNAEGEVTRGGKRKYVQINKFVEIIDRLVRDNPLPDGARVVDMGSGSGYLTFALYDHLVNTLGLNLSVVGVELRPKLVEKCRRIAAGNNFTKLRFVEGYIDDFPAERLDMLIALHACDTATDDALYKGLLAESQIMVVAPCCQKQVRKDMDVPAELKPFLGHGILLERQAAMLTDSLRALLLEAEGYKTKLFEFIPLEHTAKNVMITAVRGRRRPKAREEVRTLKERFGVGRHYLEDLIKG